MAAQKVVLVAGPFGSGKTSLLARLTSGEFPSRVAPTIGLDMDAARVQWTHASEGLSSDFAAVLPRDGLELEVWEIGGREQVHRGGPRGRAPDGLLLCFDVCSRDSFFSMAHILMNHRMDWHQANGRPALVARSHEHSWHTPVGVADGTLRLIPKRLAVVICATKADDEGGQQVSDQEIHAFAKKNGVARWHMTSAKTGDGVAAAFHALATDVMEAEQEAATDSAAVDRSVPPLSVEGWSLPIGLQIPGGTLRPMTSPRGDRPHEPPRGGSAQPLVEALDQHMMPCGVRTLEHCLSHGLLHRAVHVWLCVPTTGALLLRRYAPDAQKHPGCWGPTCNGEVRCYSDTGDGHASEMSAQAAERLLREQLGVDPASVGALEHKFSNTTRRGQCHEFLDIYFAPLGGNGGPELQLPPMEEVEWAHYGEVLSLIAEKKGGTFHMEPEYRSAIVRLLKADIVREEEVKAFGLGAAPPSKEAVPALRI